jgi:hypothetical protein
MVKSAAIVTFDVCNEPGRTRAGQRLISAVSGIEMILTATSMPIPTRPKTVDNSLQELERKQSAVKRECGGERVVV